MLQEISDFQSRFEEPLMLLALKQAQLSYSLGEVPVGAIITSKEGKLIAEGHNRTILDKDPTAHAEIVALRKTASKLGNHRLVGLKLYVTLEPCMMCVGAIFQARISQVIFGAFDSKCTSNISRCIYSLNNLNHKIQIYGGILSENCGNILRKFFTELRSKDSCSSKNFCSLEK